jgi:multidrug efflux pump subunit AcrA (membrane-fusion protein)
VDLPNRERLLIPGMYVDVAFSVDQTERPQVPAAALVFRASGPQVALIDADSRVKFVNVAITRDEGSVVELGAGVKPGDRVALNISSLIADGEQVSVNEADSKSNGGGLASAKADGAAPH